MASGVRLVGSRQSARPKARTVRCSKVGNASSRFGRSPFTSIDEHRHAGAQRLLDHHGDEPRLSAAGHADDDPVRDEVVGRQPQRFAFQRSVERSKGAQIEEGRSMAHNPVGQGEVELLEKCGVAANFGHRARLADWLTQPAKVRHSPIFFS